MWGCSVAPVACTVAAFGEMCEYWVGGQPGSSMTEVGSSGLTTTALALEMSSVLAPEPVRHLRTLCAMHTWSIPSRIPSTVLGLTAPVTAEQRLINVMLEYGIQYRIQIHI
jgi:hypothetical protein